MFFSPESQPIGGETYVYSTWLFLRLLGVVYLIAFASLWRQIHGLIGSRGILPLGRDFPAGAKFAPVKTFFRKPTIFYWDTSDSALTASCAMGVILSLLLIAGVAPVPVLVALWLLYLSLLHACGVFLSFQWDILLLETGVLAMLVAPLELPPVLPPIADPTPAGRWLIAWLLFRLIFASGVVKLRSGDKTWRNLTAMSYHYMTQPIPNRLAWMMHHLPARFHKIETAGMFFVELVVPFGLFLPAPICYISAGIIVGLMLLILTTGNYTFFNILTIALCVTAFDDGAFVWLFDKFGFDVSLPVVAHGPPIIWQWIIVAIGVLLLILAVDVIWRLFTRQPFPWPGPMRKFVDLFRPFVLVNNYGLFANMTTRRPEIILQGSNDGQNWETYEFKWKPGDLKVPPRQVAPHQPRLDWQMWFAALGNYQRNGWLINVIGRLLENSPSVVKLLKHNPFPDAPPKIVRALLYDYDFTTRAQRSATRNWWKRKLLGLYCPILTQGPKPYPYYIPPPKEEEGLK